MNLTTLRYGVESNVATITLDRPESRNALNRAMCDDIVAAAAAARDDAEVSLVLVRANGPVFCAGADLKERKGMNADEVRARRLAALRRLWRARKPADAGHRRRAGAGDRFWARKSPLAAILSSRRRRQASPRPRRCGERSVRPSGCRAFSASSLPRT